MIFIDSNGKKLYAYIATVFGGVNKAIDSPEEAYKSIKNLTSACTLTFEVSSEKGLIKKIVPMNCTNAFFDQTEVIQNVWGDCIELKNQTEIAEALKNLYPNLYGPDKEAVVETDNRRIIRMSQKGLKSHTCIVTEGTYEKVKSPRIDACKYHLSCPTPSSGSPCIDGLEAMNWIKLEIELNSEILHKAIQFSINFDESTKDQVFTPDFTWYFAPPSGHVVSSESSVIVGSTVDRNAIQGVSNRTTCYFSEWIAFPEKINERNKSRVAFRQLSEVNQNDLLMLSKFGTLSLLLQLENPQASSNRQFFYGLFIAFLLAFCSDKTRINDYYKCLSEHCTCSQACLCQTLCNAITWVAPILLVLSFLSIILPPEKDIPNQGKRVKIFIFIVRYVLAIGVTFALIIYVFLGWLLFPDYISSHINCFWNQRILIIGASIAFISNIVYLIYCFVFLKRKIYNYI